MPPHEATVDGRKLSELVWKPAVDPEGKAIGRYHVQVSPREDFLHPISPNFDSLVPSNRARWKLPTGWFIPGPTYY